MAVPCNVVTTNSKRQMEIRALADRQKMILILELHLQLGTKLESCLWCGWINAANENCRLVTVGERQRWTKLQQIRSSQQPIYTNMQHKSRQALNSLPKRWNNLVKTDFHVEFYFRTNGKISKILTMKEKNIKWARRTMMRWLVFCHSNKSNIQKYHGMNIKSS